MNAWLRDGPPLVIGHRGSRERAPENTLAAFRLAAEDGADAIEFDVRATTDGRLVVIHDASLERTTDGRGEIASLTLDEVRRADAGVRRGEAFAGERVPTLEEVLALARGRLLVDIELKVAGIEAQVLDAVDRLGMGAEALITSFHEEAVAASMQQRRDVPAGLLQESPNPDRAFELGVPAYLPRIESLSVELMSACRARRVRVIPWTARTEEEADRAAGFGVCGIIADDPAMVRKVIDRAR